MRDQPEHGGATVAELPPVTDAMAAVPATVRALEQPASSARVEQAARWKADALMTILGSGDAVL
jgi:hypothetical protein